MSAIIHGGDIQKAMQLASESGFDAGKADDWLDLSTGINPNPYPISDISPSHWHRLPQKSDTDALRDAALTYYGAPSSNHIMPAPGSSILINMLPTLLDAQPISIVAPTYGDHATAWERGGHTIKQIGALEMSDPSGITILVNPNNPDGTLYDSETLKAQARLHGDAGGILIVDEAFGDCVPHHSAVPLTGEHNVIVLKSMGKFFGLAGMRLGFAIARPDICARLSAHLGPWALSGPALSLGLKALQDTKWHEQTRGGLKAASSKLNHLLHNCGLERVGHTDLFTLIENKKAGSLFERLLKNKIYVRRFDYNPHWLRIGLPDSDENYSRLQQAIIVE